MSEAEIKNLVDKQNICRIAINGNEYPYLAPFRYIRIGDALYFHFTNYGRKMRLIKKNRKVSVQIEFYKPDLSSYEFVSFRGELEQVKDKTEYDKAVFLFSETGEKTLSKNFLAAHGFNPIEGWSEFKKSQGLVIMKLINISEEIGLKNP